MNDVNQAVLSELERLYPVPSAASDWGAVMRRARQARRNRLLVLSAAAVVIAVLVPAVALSITLQRLLGFSHGVRPVFAQAQLLVQAPAGDGLVVRSYVSPSTSGGRCEFEVFARAGSAIHPRDLNGGSSCSNLANPHARVPPLSFVYSKGRSPLAAWLRPDHTGPHAYLGGAVAPGLGAQRVELRWVGGRMRLRFAHGHFLVATDRIFNPPLRALPFRIVALDSTGHVVVRQKLDNKMLYMR